MLIKNKLYNGEVELIFDAFRHRYTWEGQEIKSVTKVLSVINKPALVSWSSNMAIDYCAEQIQPGVSYDELQLAAVWQKGRKAHWEKKVNAGDLGTFLHKWVEKYINGENPGMPVNPELQESVLKFLIWVKKHKVKFILSEQVIFSKKYLYCGTTDFICVVDGKLYIGDLKTSNGVYPEMLMQTAAYRNARGEEFPEENYEGQLIVRIGKDGTFEFVMINDSLSYTVDNATINGRQLYQIMLDGFLAARNLSFRLDQLNDYKADKNE